MTFPSKVGHTPISKTIWFYYYHCYYYWSYLVACGILVLNPGIEPKPPAMEAWSLPRPPGKSLKLADCTSTILTIFQ